MSENVMDSPFKPQADVNTGNSDELSCQFYLERKKRKCKALKRIGHYCTEHSYLLSDNDSIRKRIPCPLDPRHTIFEDLLQKHLRRCAKRPELRPVYYQENINTGDDSGYDPAQYKVTLRGVEEAEVIEMIDRCQQLYNEHIGEMKTEVLFHEVLREEYDSPKKGDIARKHILQQASLIGHMDRLGLLGDKRCFVEFGAGKGGLSHWLQRSVRHHDDTQFVLVDKGSVRYKMDTFHKGEDQGPNFERLKIDIEHLDIDKIPNLENDRKIIAVGKHLCGAATDLMLRCLTTLKPRSGCSREMSGVVLALCCHHRCDWRSYVGKHFMTQQCGLTARQFSIMCGMTSWATCSTAHVDPDTVKHSKPYSHPRSGNLLPQQREEIGNQCKQLIDWGRAQYLRQHGLEAELRAFVDKKYTLENVCLLAHKRHYGVEETKPKPSNDDSIVNKLINSDVKLKESACENVEENRIDESNCDSEQNMHQNQMILGLNDHSNTEMNDGINASNILGDSKTDLQTCDIHNNINSDSSAVNTDRLQSQKHSDIESGIQNLESGLESSPSISKRDISEIHDVNDLDSRSKEQKVS